MAVRRCCCSAERAYHVVRSTSPVSEPTSHQKTNKAKSLVDAQRVHCREKVTQHNPIATTTQLPIHLIAPSPKAVVVSNPWS
eukprot:4682171-Amphidinium_carterae.4